MQKEKEIKYFYTFDTFRFISFLLVFLCHLPLIPESSALNYFTKSGGIGVCFFFFLSGFLISYKLIVENKNEKKINLKNFFLRRILRIWPLYYLMVLFAFATPHILKILNLPSSDEGYTPTWILNILFLDNYKMMITQSHPNISPLWVMWSLCVEEHFYLIWGIVFFFLRNKYIPTFLIISILIANVTRIIFNIYDISTSDVFSNLDYFSVGGLLAFTLVYKKSLIDKMNHIKIGYKYLTAIGCFVTILFISNYSHHYKISFLLSPICLNILFIILLALTLCSQHPLRINKNNLFNRLGKYTYGLYMYHTIIINLFLQLNNQYFCSDNYIAFFFIALFVSIVVAILSYYIYEKPFLNLKKYFS